MSLVPSHDCLLLKEAFSNTCLSSVRLGSQTDSVLGFAGLLPHQLFSLSSCTIHLLARCDHSGGPPACITRRSI